MIEVALALPLPRTPGRSTSARDRVASPSRSPPNARSGGSRPSTALRRRLPWLVATPNAMVSSSKPGSAISHQRLRRPGTWLWPTCPTSPRRSLKTAAGGPPRPAVGPRWGSRRSRSDPSVDRRSRPAAAPVRRCDPRAGRRPGGRSRPARLRGRSRRGTPTARPGRRRKGDRPPAPLIEHRFGDRASRFSEDVRRGWAAIQYSQFKIENSSG